MGVVLTIAASGSESSTVPVLTDDETHEKLVYEHPCLLPRFAIMNLKLTYTAPALPTACGTAASPTQGLPGWVAPATSLPASLGQSLVGALPAQELTELALACSQNRTRTVGCFFPLDYDGMLAVHRSANQ